MRKFFFLPVFVGTVCKSLLGRGFKGIVLFFIATMVVSTYLSVSFMHVKYLYSLSLLIPPYFLIGMIYAIIFAWRDQDIDSKGELGKAIWSTKKDLFNAGLQGDGIVFGKIEGELVVKPSSQDGHVLFVGGSGTGKSAAHGIPTLTKWKGTGLTIDIKGELSQSTSHLHKKSIVFSTEEKMARYNPLDFIKEIEDVQEIGRLMFPKPEKGDPFWSQSAQAVFSSACWEFKDTKNFSEVAQWLCTETHETIIETLLSSRQLETKILINTVANLKPEMLGTIFAEVRGKLMTLAVDKNIQYATSGSDFSPESIETSMIYLKVSEKRLKQYGELFGVIVGQFLRYLTGRKEKKDPPVLVMLDEFPRLGQMNEIVDGLATLRSRNVHLVLMIQSLAQLDQKYGKDTRRVIVDNCAYKLVLLASDTDTQKYFSEMAGNKTVKIKSVSQSEGLRKEQQFTTQEQSVPLIRPEEFGVLQKPILFGFRLRPAEVEQVYWFKDKQMKNLVESKIEVS